MKLKIFFYLASVIMIISFFIWAFKSSNDYETSVNKKIKNSRDTTWIFNGKDLSNLKLILDNQNINTDSIYGVKNKSIFFKKGYKGFLRTKEKYSNFYLHAEWMWPQMGEKGNSGILVFIQPPDTIWPNCIQVNFKEDHAGDLIGMSGAEFKEATGKPQNTAVISKSSEKPEGEWNTCDVICEGDSLIAKINGIIQNKATKIANHNGAIGWQLEGKAIALKNIYLIQK
jgi:3-keto-disaccharide hydrolase